MLAGEVVRFKRFERQVLTYANELPSDRKRGEKAQLQAENKEVICS